MIAMKAPAEMNEGPQALERFENTMKALFSKRKADVLPEKRTKDEPSTKRGRTKTRKIACR